MSTEEGQVDKPHTLNELFNLPKKQRQKIMEAVLEASIKAQNETLEKLAQRHQSPDSKPFEGFPGAPKLIE